MIFRSGVFSRRPDLTSAQFAEHWTNVHGVLAREMPGLHSYLQNHIEKRHFEIDPMPSHAVDGISQLWFDDIAAMERSEQSPEYALCKLDIPRFQGAITILVLEGTTASGSRPPAEGKAKLLWFARQRRPHAGDVAARVAPTPPAEAIATASSLVVDRAHPVSAGVPAGEFAADAMEELWFDDNASLERWLYSQAGQARVMNDALLEPMAVYTVREHRVL
jgi:uncharacterized protein (TIGR02118 family)